MRREERRNAPVELDLGSFLLVLLAPFRVGSHEKDADDGDDASPSDTKTTTEQPSTAK